MLPASTLNFMRSRADSDPTAEYAEHHDDRDLRVASTPQPHITPSTAAVMILREYPDGHDAATSPDVLVAPESSQFLSRHPV